MTPFDFIEKAIYGSTASTETKQVQSVYDIVLSYNISDGEISPIVKKYLVEAFDSFRVYLEGTDKNTLGLDGISEIRTIADFNKICEDAFEKLKDSFKLQDITEFRYEILAQLDPFVTYWISFDYTIKLFNRFCQSVLKGEYLYDDHLSVARIEPLQQNIEHYLLSKPWILNYNDDPVDIEKVYLGDVQRLCSLYYVFNRNIDKAIDENANAVLKTIATDSSYDEFAQYNIGLNALYSNMDNVAILWNAAQIFPYLFHSILDMTYIDHNFAVGEKELDTLLNLKETLKHVMEFMQKLAVSLSSIKEPAGETENEGAATTSGRENAYLNEKDLSSIEDLLNTLRIIDIKNNYLIYKIHISDKSDKLKNYTFIVNGGIITFKQEKLGDKLKIDYLDRKKLVSDFCDENKNDLLKESVIYNKLIAERFVWNREESFTSYEVYFFKAIGNKTEFDKIKIYFDNINSSFVSQKCEISTEKHVDITSYNRKIAYHAKNQFTKYGKYIKELSLLVNAGNVKAYIARLEQLITKNSVVYSCSFIIKHTELVLNELEKLCRNKSGIDSDWGFRLRMLAESLLVLYQRLIKSIHDGDYCINFASLYQDAFYRFALNKNPEGKQPVGQPFLESIQRVKLNDVDQIFEDEENAVTCFIASTWMQPVGKIALKENYDRLNNKKTELVACFYSIYFQQQEQKNKEREDNFRLLRENFQIEVDETKHAMVQTLGIFATFLALATVSLGGFGKEFAFVDFFKVIGGITFCLGIFVLMLRFIVNTKFVNKANHYLNLIVFACILLILLGVILLL